MKKILIVKLSAIGDVIHSLIVIEFLKKKGFYIDWLIEESLKGVVEDTKVDNILTINLKSIKKSILNLPKELKKISIYKQNNYDYIIDMQGLIKSAIVSKLLKSKNTIVIGFDKNSIRESVASIFYDKKISSSYSKNIILRNLDLIREFIEVSKNDILNKESFFNIEAKKKKFIIFVVGASKDNKIYPKEKFLELAKKLDDKILVVWGNQKEKEIAIWLSKNSKNIKLARKMDFKKLKKIVKSAKIVIGGDTGIVHLAWGLNTASITIFGNTPWQRNCFITPINKVVYSKDVNPLKIDKNDFSIKEIPINKILEQIKDIKV